MVDLAPERIGYINAHGTGTPSNDLTSAGSSNVVEVTRDKIAEYLKPGKQRHTHEHGAGYDNGRTHA